MGGRKESTGIYMYALWVSVTLWHCRYTREGTVMSSLDMCHFVTVSSCMG